MSNIIKKNLLRLKNIKNVKQTILESCKHLELPKPNILILNTPCHGFGDIIFAIKLARYLRQWYDANVKIATTKYKQFISIGEDKENLYELKAKTSNSKAEDCRRFKYLRFVQPIPEFDLLFVAPLQADFEISKNDIKYLIDYSDDYNTYFFSEYNDRRYKKFDFPTGIGGNRLGLFLTDVSITDHLSNTNKLQNPYALCYIAETIIRSTQCFLGFFNMICKKYSKKYDTDFDIVCPSWIVKKLSENKKAIKPFLRYYSKVVLVNKDSKEEISTSTGKNVLSIRGDILPVPNKEMITLMIHSVDDMLLTGDQSITDALSCCYKKNIWYQIAPWKENFGKELAKNLPQKYYKKKTTSCGTISGINYKSNFESFVNKWDFRKLAKEKMDNVIKFTSIKKDVKNILQIVKTSRTLKTLKNKIDI